MQKLMNDLWELIQSPTTYITISDPVLIKMYRAEVFGKRMRDKHKRRMNDRFLQRRAKKRKRNR